MHSFFPSPSLSFSYFFLLIFCLFIFLPFSFPSLLFLFFLSPPLVGVGYVVSLHIQFSWYDSLGLCNLQCFETPWESLGWRTRQSLGLLGTLALPGPVSRCGYSHVIIVWFLMRRGCELKRILILLLLLYSNWLTMVSTLYTVLCVHVFWEDFEAHNSFNFCNKFLWGVFHQTCTDMFVVGSCMT